MKNAQKLKSQFKRKRKGTSYFNLEYDYYPDLRNSHIRYMKTFQEIRESLGHSTQAKMLGVKIKTRKNIPTSWDDLKCCVQKSWKYMTKRKNQWSVK